jgi:hypothetical protein
VLWSILNFATRLIDCLDNVYFLKTPPNRPVNKQILFCLLNHDSFFKKASFLTISTRMILFIWKFCKILLKIFLLNSVFKNDFRLMKSFEITIFSVFITCYLSISPKTISIVPIIVTKSAKKCPFINLGNTCMWWYAGDLTLHL